MEKINVQENVFRQKKSTLVSANWPLNNWAQGTKSCCRHCDDL